VQRLFKRIFEDRPPNVLISSFNEHIGGRRFSSQYDSSEIGKFNMGLLDENPYERPGVWVDT